MMYNVLIVDDENPALDMLKIIIDWEERGFYVADTAFNGREAFEKYENNHYDLIITDIQMPVMNGIEFIKRVKEKKPEQPIIILSCHEEFSYAKAAVKMGVTDYLIKDLLTKEDLYTVLGKVKETLKHEDERLKTLEVLKKYLLMDDYLFTIQNEMLKSIILENLSHQDIETKINKLNIDLKSDDYLLLHMTEDHVHEKDRELHHDEKNIYRRCIVDTVNTVLNDRAYGKMDGGMCVYLKEGEYVALVKVQPIISEKHYLADSYALASKIKRDITKLVGNSLTIIIGQVFGDLSKAPNMYEQTKDTLLYRFYFGKGKILFYNTIIKKVAPVKPEKIEEVLNSIHKWVEERNITGLMDSIELIYQDAANGFMQYNYVQYIATRFMEMVMRISKEYAIAYQELFGTNYLPLNTIQQLDTIDDIKNWFKDLFTRIVTKMNEKKSTYSLRVLQATKYITQNYHKAISLNDIANHLHINKIYLSRIFKEETKMTITEYIHYVRIEESKKLIQHSDYKMYDIAERVGYINIQHFNTRFKKITGMTPLQFKKTNKK